MCILYAYLKCISYAYYGKKSKQTISIHFTAHNVVQFFKTVSSKSSSETRNPKHDESGLLQMVRNVAV